MTIRELIQGLTDAATAPFLDLGRTAHMADYGQIVMAMQQYAAKQHLPMLERADLSERERQIVERMR